MDHMPAVFFFVCLDFGKDGDPLTAFYKYKKQASRKDTQGSTEKRLP